MKFTEMDVSIRLHSIPDSEVIVPMINRDRYHLLNGISVKEFEQSLDEPDRRIRENTFVVEFNQTIIAYFSLCFVEQSAHTSVDCFGTVDKDWRRRGIGTIIFKFIFRHLEELARQNSEPVHFKHRALTSIPGEVAIGIEFGMQAQNILEVLCLNNLTEHYNINLLAEYKFRSPTMDDAEVWADIYNEAFSGNRGPESFAYEFKGDGFSKDLYLLCTNENGEPIALISSFLKGAHARIPTLAVRHDWQKRGVGQCLLSEIIKRLKLRGALDVRLTVDSNNAAAKLLYNKFGFKQEYQRINYSTTFMP